MNRWEKNLASKRGLCSGCGKTHYMSKRAQPGGEQNTLHLTARGWWVSDILRSQARKRRATG